MIENLKTALEMNKGVILDVVSTTKNQIVESVSATKLPVFVAGGTVATSFTSIQAAQWAGACLSIMLAGKVLVDIWARINEITLKKRTLKLEIKRQERALRNESKDEL